jgi:hypothetical protein
MVHQPPFENPRVAGLFELCEGNGHGRHMFRSDDRGGA